MLPTSNPNGENSSPFHSIKLNNSFSKQKKLFKCVLKCSWERYHISFCPSFYCLAQHDKSHQQKNRNKIRNCLLEDKFPDFIAVSSLLCILNRLSLTSLLSGSRKHLSGTTQHPRLLSIDWTDFWKIPLQQLLTGVNLEITARHFEKGSLRGGFSMTVMTMAFNYVQHLNTSHLPPEDITAISVLREICNRK